MVERCRLELQNDTRGNWYTVRVYTHNVQKVIWNLTLVRIQLSLQKTGNRLIGDQKGELCSMISYIMKYGLQSCHTGLV